MIDSNSQLSDHIKLNAGINKKIGIVQSLWNQDITDQLSQGCLDTLIKFGVNKNNIQTLAVPGSFELIYGGKKIYKEFQLDAIILIGSIIKGETPHFNFIAESIAHGIKDLNILFDIPFIFCVLTDLNKDQALSRSGGKMGNKGIDAAYTALQLIQN
tara:strand:- start:34 stop:504 length:471 start_codon:yes stop_codon:yes gene_type:complete